MNTEQDNKGREMSKPCDGRFPYSIRIRRDLDACPGAPEYTYWIQFHTDASVASQRASMACNREFRDNSYVQDVQYVPAALWRAKSWLRAAELHGAARALNMIPNDQLVTFTELRI